jgi:hypothetical protein
MEKRCRRVSKSTTRRGVAKEGEKVQRGEEVQKRGINSTAWRRGAEEGETVQHGEE